MPSLQDQLTEIEQKELGFQVEFNRLKKIDSALDNANWICGLLSFASVVTFFVLLYTYFPKLGNFDIIPIATFYGGVFLVAGLHAVLVKLFKRLPYSFYKMSKAEYFKTITIKEKLNDQKNTIRKQIKLEEEIKYRERESKLVQRLNELVGIADKGKLSDTKIIELKKELLAEYIVIKHYKLQLHTNIYYTNRFTIIDESLGGITPKVNPQKVIPQQQAPLIPSNKPVQKVTTVKVDETTKEKPFVDADKAVESTKDENKSIGNEKLTEKKTIIPEEVVKIVTEPFGKSKPESSTKDTVKNAPHIQVKVDFQKLNEHRHNIGELGEQYILSKEKKTLISKGKIKQSQEVIHVSAKSDAEGYDIISFTETGERKYIEVKTTTGNEFEPFYLSNTEMEAMKRLSNYWIYRVYNFDLDLKIGNLYMVDCSKNLELYYQISASSYKITPKPKY